MNKNQVSMYKNRELTQTVVTEFYCSPTYREVELIYFIFYFLNCLFVQDGDPLHIDPARALNE